MKVGERAGKKLGKASVPRRESETFGEDKEKVLVNEASQTLEG